MDGKKNAADEAAPLVPPIKQKTAKKVVSKKPARKSVRAGAKAVAKKSVAKKVVKTTKAKVATSKALYAQVDAQVCAVLMELMCASESDAVRVSAAKALMDQAKRNEEADDDGDKGHDRQERSAVLAEIRRIMGALADAKSGGGLGALEMDQHGASGAIDAEG